MPLFADLAAMQARFEERDLVQLTDEAGAGEIDAATVNSRLVSADALITSYVAARHKDVPALAGHPLLTDIACDYAFSLLWRSDMPDWVKDRRKLAIETLKNISSGAVKLDQGEETAPPRPGQIHVSGPERRFGRDSLDGY